MRLISYRKGNETGVGVMVDDQTFVALASVAPNLPVEMRELLRLPDGLRRAAEASRGKAASHALSDVALDPVVPNPSAVWCAALNYSEHQAEVGRQRSEFPEVFLRPSSSFVGHGQPLMAPYGGLVTRYDFEGELVAIIGTAGRHISKDDALKHVAGYTIGNEGSVRDYQRHNRQYGIGKSFDQSGSYGPWLMTADEFGYPYSHSLVTRSEGTEKQRCSIGSMLSKIEEIISYVSIGYGFQPGDVIFTGTPASLPGTTKKMNPGDVVEIEVSGLGVLRNPVVQASAR